MKYKCKECGHIFEGNLSTDCCPECGGDVETYSGGPFSNMPWKKIFIVIGIIAIILLMCLIFRKDNKTANYSITVSQDSINVYVEVSCTNDSLNLRELRDSCQILVYDTNEVQLDNPRLFSLKSNKMSYAISMFEPGCTYKVVLGKRKGGKEICSDTFTIPLPPSPPVIAVEPAIAETDPKDKCRLLGTYKVVIKVKEGKADKFSIDGVEYDSNIITGVEPRTKESQYVIVRAYNSEDRLWSDSVSYKLPPINQSTMFAPNIKEIQEIFDRVATTDKTKKMQPGDAMEKISNNQNILVKVNGKKSNLEDELQVSYQTKTRLVIKKVNYEGNECSRSIVSIEI